MQIFFHCWLKVTNNEAYANENIYEMPIYNVYSKAILSYIAQNPSCPMVYDGFSGYG